MRLGLSDGIIPTNPAAVDEHLAATLVELGFTGILVRFGASNIAENCVVDVGACRNAREVLGAHGVRIVQSWGMGANLIAGRDRQPIERKKLDEAFKIAVEMGADAIIVGSGSLNPRGRYYPHPKNHSPETESLLVRNLRSAARSAANHGLFLCLEGHCLTTLNTPERIERIVAAVDSPTLKVNLDPMNLVGDIGTLWDHSELLNELFARLGECAISGHIKDLHAEDRVVVHLSETLISEGVFDLETYVKLFERFIPNSFMFLEHLPGALVPRGKSALDSLLERCEVSVR